MTYFVTHPENYKMDHEKFRKTQSIGSLTIVHLAKSGKKK